jgi:hypothetical protein
MGLDTKTYWLNDRQSQCDFDFDLSLLLPCGGGIDSIRVSVTIQQAVYSQTHDQ